MGNVLNRIESFLRIDRLTTKSDIMRARAVYMMGLAFIATQTINLGTMYYSYGFSFDHIISILACGFVAGTILMLRHNQNFRSEGIQMMKAAHILKYLSLIRA